MTNPKTNSNNIYWKKIFNKCQEQNLEFNDNDPVYSLICNENFGWKTQFIQQLIEKPGYINY